MQRSARDQPVLTTVVPAFDEAARLPATIAAVGAHLARSPALLPSEIVVVDDGSRDGTAAAASSCSLPAGVVLEVVRHEHNRGKGAAVRSGFAASRGRLVLVSDADLATPIEELGTLLAAAGEDGVAIGSRAVDRSRIEVRQPWYRDLMGRTFNLVVRALAVPGIRDTQCGFKLLPGPVARDLAGVMEVDGFAWDVELLLLLRRWGVPVAEVPVAWRHVEASRVRPVRHSAEMLAALLRLWRRRLTGGLPPRPGGDGSRT